MWFKKLKKKKLQSLLIGTLLFLTSLIFASSLSMITSINDYVSKYYSNDKFYDLILYNSNEGVTKDIINWCKNNTQVKDVKAIDAYTSGNDIYLNDKKLKLALYDVVPLEDMNSLPYGINKVNSLDKESYPKEGEVWLTQLLADSFKISLGDKITIKTKDKDINLKVSSLINDSLQPSSTSTQIVFYINKNSAKDFSLFRNAPIVLIDTKEGANVSDVQKDLIKVINVEGYNFDKAALIQSATSISSTVGGICVLASLLVFIVSVLIIRFILWNNILKEYKSIGMYKALGFSRGEILKFYIIGYSVIAILGSTIGAFLSIPVLNYTAARVLKYIGKFDGININFSVIFSTILIFSLVTIVSLYFVIRRTNKISPVDALRTGVTSSRKKLTKSLIKDTASPLALAINDIFKYKKVTLFISLTLTCALSLVLLFGNLNVSISKMKDNTNIWFGFPSSNITISAPIFASSGALKDVLNMVKTDNRVKNYVYGSVNYTAVQLDTKKYPIKSPFYDIFLMNSYNKDLGFSIIEGRNPEKENEVEVSLKILQETALSVGDYIELSINNKKNTYLITGSYNSLMSNGYGIRMLNSALEKEIPEFVGTELFVNLKDASKADEFEKDINDKFNNIDASDLHPLIQYSIESVPGTILPMSYLLMVVFIAFSIITILNIFLMNIRDNTRNFGIMKALGFTSKDISLRYLYRILILTFISTIVAVVLNLLFSKPLISASISKLDVLSLYPATMSKLIFTMIFLVILITLICLRNIKNTKPTELIEE